MKIGKVLFLKFSAQNSILTMIDQLSAVLAPLIAGFILSYTSYRTGCIIFVGWNAFDWLLEAILLRSVYRAVPELATRIRTTSSKCQSRFFMNFLNSKL